MNTPARLMIGLTLVALTVLPLIGCGNDDGESAQEPVTVAVEGTRQGVDGLTDRDRARARRIVMGDPELRELVPNRVRDEVRVVGPHADRRDRLFGAVVEIRLKEPLTADTELTFAGYPKRGYIAFKAPWRFDDARRLGVTADLRTGQIIYTQVPGRPAGPPVNQLLPLGRERQPEDCIQEPPGY